jgi:hypothetical protein
MTSMFASSDESDKTALSIRSFKAQQNWGFWDFVDEVWK